MSHIRKVTASLDLHTSQENFLFDQLIDKDNPKYNIGGYVCFTGKIEVPLLMQAISYFEQHHESCAMRIDPLNKQQIFYQAEPSPKFKEIDLTASTEAEKKAIQWMQERMDEACDIEELFTMEHVFFHINEQCGFWFFKLHHLATDAYGISVMLARVQAIYNALLADIALPEYKEEGFISAEIQSRIRYLDSDSYLQDKEFWQEKLSAKSLVSLTPKYADNTTCRELEIEIPAELRLNIENFCQKNNFNLLQLSIAALTIYFTQFGQSTSLAFGVPIHNRVTRKQQNLFASLVNTITCHSAFKADQSIEDFIKEIKLELTGGMLHRNYPTSHLYRLLNSEQTSTARLFDILVNYQKVSVDLGFTGSRAEVSQLTSSQETIPLYVNWCDYGDDHPLKVRLKYRQDYFSKTDISRLAQCMLSALASFCHFPEQQLNNISLINEADSQKQLRQCAMQRAQEKPTDSLVELFEKACKSNSAKLALTGSAGEMSYQELNGQVNALAMQLQQEGLAAGQRIALCLPRSQHLVIAMLAALKIGAIYVLVAPTLPSSTRTAVLEQTMPNMAISLDIRPSWLQGDVTWVNMAYRVTYDGKIFVQSPDANALKPICIAYAATRTSMPKCVELNQTALIRLLCNIDYTELNSNTVMAFCSNAEFDVSVFEVLGSLLHGGTLVIIDEGIEWAPETLSTAIAQYNINTLFMASTLFQYHLENSSNTLAVKYLLCAGQSTSFNSAQKILTQFNKLDSLTFLYGPMENTLFSLWQRISTNTLIDSSFVYGQSLEGTEVYVLDQMHRLLPEGAIGNLYIGGTGLVNGYLSSFKETAFIDHPYSVQDGAQLYRSGEQVRWISENQLEFIDDMALNGQENASTLQSNSDKINFWQDYLSGAPQLHDLPLDYSRPAVQEGRTESYNKQLSGALLHKFTRAAIAHQVPLSLLMQTCFIVLMARLSGQEELVVGLRCGTNDIPVNKRKVLPLRISLDPEESFSSLLSLVKGNQAACLNHSALDHNQLEQLLKLTVNPSYSTQFQILFEMVAGNEKQRLDLTVEPYQYDLHLRILELENSLQVSFLFDAAIFKLETIQRFGDYFESLLLSITNHHEQNIFTLPLVDENEKNRQISLLSGDIVNINTEMCIHELFERQVQLNPEQIAVVFEQESLTYLELNCRANRLAAYLNIQGVKPDSMVGICMLRSIEMVVAIIAILKSGGAYVPLDPDFPPERLTYILDDTDVKILLVQKQLKGLLPPLSCPVICLDEVSVTMDLMAYSDQDQNKSKQGLTSSNLAYVIYTSGSTGQPKGVMVEHNAIHNRIDWMQRSYQLTSTDRVLQKTPYSFDVSVWEFLWTLSYGAILVVALPGGHKEPEYLSQLIHQEKITILHFVPSMLNAYLNSSTTAFSTSVRQVFCSGEALNIDEVRTLKDQAPHVKLHNLYGPTEAAIDVTYFPCAQTGDRHSVPIGKSIQNIQHVILDGTLNFCPIGVPGELHIAGVGLARGYVNKDSMTRDKFIDNPFKNILSERLYKTGDLVRCLSDGNIEFMARVDDQVKIRGFRIELGEIEHQLQNCAGISSCLLQARADNLGQKELVAYVLPDSVRTVHSELIEQWQQSLRLALPEYMIPSAFVFLKQWPLTSSGKINKKALPAPDRTTTSGEYIAAASDSEIKLVEIWAKLLKADIESISATANFFDLGGHSLLVMKLINEVASAFKLESEFFSVKDIFSSPILKDIAFKIDVVLLTDKNENTKQALEGLELVEEGEI